MGCFIAPPNFFMKSIAHRRAFTLLEIVVILGIIALFLALLVPFAIRSRQGGRSAACVNNMKAIGKAMAAYAADNEGRLPGPLTMDQYPVESAGTPPREGQLLKYIAKYFDGPGGARAAFTYPAWKTAQRATDSAVFLANVKTVLPYEQSPWGEMTEKSKGPLKADDLRTVKYTIGEDTRTAEVAKFWALTEADQVLARNLGAGKGDAWVLHLPANAVHVSHRNALYFDWHVDRLVDMYSTMSPPTAD